MNPLITVSELRDRLGHLTVLDVRYRMGDPTGRAQFEVGHVPGAAYVDLDVDLAAPPGRGGRHPLPEPQVFEAAMRRCGVSHRRPVVVYDDWSAHAAGRCWWLLRHHGHADVRVLDGGWSAWTDSSGPVETGPVETGPVETGPGDSAPGDFVAGPGILPIVDASTVVDVDVLIDARAPERYRGEVEPIDPVAGHIPGAGNVPTSSNLAADGTFKSVAELQALYAEVGAVPGADVAVYCGSGVTATHDLIALEIAGVTAALYPGSWSDWVSDPDRPTTSESL
ncbi:MAG: sulfurtransferase [Nocardioides sp.]